MILPFGKVPVGQMDEISLGQFQELAEDLIGVVDSKLSADEREHLVQNDLNFNDVMMNGLEHTTNKDGKKYDLNGGGEPNAILTFMIMDGDK